MAVDTNMTVQFNEPVTISNEKTTGDLQLSSEKSKKVSLIKKFSGFMKDLYSKVVNSEAVRSFISIFGHVALNIGETMAMGKVKEVIKENYPERAELYTAVATEALGRTALVAKKSLPQAKSIPDDLFKILCDSLTDYQINALKHEQQLQREQAIQQALNEDV